MSKKKSSGTSKPKNNGPRIGSQSNMSDETRGQNRPPRIDSDKPKKEN